MLTVLLDNGNWIKVSFKRQDVREQITTWGEQIKYLQVSLPLENHSMCPGGDQSGCSVPRQLSVQRGARVRAADTCHLGTLPPKPAESLFLPTRVAQVGRWDSGCHFSLHLPQTTNEAQRWGRRDKKEEGERKKGGRRGRN